MGTTTPYWWLFLSVLCSSLVSADTCRRQPEEQRHCKPSAMEALANGANDVIVTQRPDGSYASTAWTAQIGKLHSLLQSREGHTVHIFVNNVPARARMEICDSGTLAFTGASANYMTSRELGELNLKPGLNEGKYVARKLGMELSFRVFLFNVTDRLVVTDIDGTITDHEVRGLVLPRLGISSAEHVKVVELFHRVGAAGYRLVYLTARSMSQDEETKEYLFSMLQNQSQYSLPQGPVLFSPEPLISSLLAEVVHQNPDVQKTKTLLDVWNIFNSNNKANIDDTIVAGYGNKETDVKAYTNAGISRNHIWLVDSSGVLRNVGTGHVTSYEEQALSVHSLYHV